MRLRREAVTAVGGHVQVDVAAGDRRDIDGAVVGDVDLRVDAAVGERCGDRRGRARAGADPARAVVLRAGEVDAAAVVPDGVDMAVVRAAGVRVPGSPLLVVGRAGVDQRRRAPRLSAVGGLVDRDPDRVPRRRVVSDEPDHKDVARVVPRHRGIGHHRRACWQRERRRVVPRLATVGGVLGREREVVRMDVVKLLRRRDDLRRIVRINDKAGLAACVVDV